MDIISSSVPTQNSTLLSFSLPQWSLYIPLKYPRTQNEALPMSTLHYPKIELLHLQPTLAITPSFDCKVVMHLQPSIPCDHIWVSSTSMPHHHF